MYPSGITYQEIEKIIESVATAKAQQYGSISYLDNADIAQEVRIKCWHVLINYNPKRPNANLITFLSVCADNRIKDLKRILVYKHDKPCSRCKHYSKGKCLKFNNKMQCKQFARHEMRIRNKISCSNAIDIYGQNICDSRSDLFIKNVDFFDFIYTHLPPPVVPLFNRLRDSNFDFSVLKVRERKMLRHLIGEIYIRYGGFNERG